MKRFLIGLTAFLALAAGAIYAQQPAASRVAGRYVAANYAKWGGVIAVGNTATGSQTITVCPAVAVLPDGRNFSPYNVTSTFTVDQQNTTVSETVTPTAVSIATSGLPSGYSSCALVTASFNNLHGSSNNPTQVVSGDSGLGEAIADAQNNGGGVVVVDGQWPGTTSTITSAVPFSTVAVEDARGSTQYWTATQSVATLLAAPTTLTATTVGFGLNGANTSGGTYTGTSTYHVCVAYVDIAGQEGPCSADFSSLTAGTGATNQIGFSAPAASTGAVGFIPYISLASGSYNLTYQVPVTSSVCTLTKVETTTPACAVTNSTYGQTGSAAVVSALTVNTAPLHLLLTTASTTSAYIGTPNGRTTYVYAAHASIGIPGVPASMQAYTIGSATATTVPSVIGTVSLPAGLMNVVGRTLHVCGEATEASAGSTATIENIELLWDGAGSNTAGAPVIVQNLTSKVTLVTSNADFIAFCGDIQTTVSGASVTAGSIGQVGGFITAGSGAGGTQATGSGQDQTAAAVASLNLSGAAGNSTRLHVVYNHTTGTDAAGMTLLGLTISAI